MANHRIINRILLSVLSSLIGPIHECMLRGTHVESAASAALGAHGKIVDAVRAHAPREARIAMKRHMELTRDELTSLIDAGIDLNGARAGGFTEVQRIAQMAADTGHPCIPHDCSTDILEAATLQLVVAIPNALLVEVCAWESPLNNELTEPRIWIDKNGEVESPCGPGLSVRVRQDVVDRYRV